MAPLIRSMAVVSSSRRGRQLVHRALADGQLVAKLDEAALDVDHVHFRPITSTLKRTSLLLSCAGSD